jgi:ferrous iron transport protein B
MLQQGKQFCVTAGTIIFALTVVVWALGYYPHPASITESHQARAAEARQDHDRELAESALRLDASLTPQALPAFEPVASLLGEIEAAEDEFTARMIAADVEQGSPQWTIERRAMDDRISALAAEGAAPGQAALDVYRADQKLKRRLRELDQAEASAYLQQSILGRMGVWIEPLVEPLGWDWRIGTAVLASLPAREVVIATLGTIYNLGNEQRSVPVGLRAKLHAARGPDGRPAFNLAVALSIMMFFALCCQCGGTLAAIKRETNSWRWPMFTFAYMTLLAYAAALITYQIASRLI